MDEKSIVGYALVNLWRDHDDDDDDDVRVLRGRVASPRVARVARARGRPARR